MVKIEEKNGVPQISFVIGAMPMKVYDEFDSIAKEDFGHCYWMTIKELLENKKNADMVNTFVEGMYSELQQLKMDIVELKDKLYNQGVEDLETEPKPTTGLGSKIED